GTKVRWYPLSSAALGRPQPASYIGWYWSGDDISTRIIGVLLAVVLIYIVGVFVGNFIGRTAWRLAETALMRVPFVRAIYPSVKQVTDFILNNRQTQLAARRVVGVQPHATGIWPMRLVRGTGMAALGEI